MLGIVFTGLLILGFLKLSDKENVLDLMGSATLYVVPLILVAAGNYGISYFQLPIALSFVLYSLYAVVPYVFLNVITTYSLKKKLLLSIGILFIVFVSEVIQYIVFAQ